MEHLNAQSHLRYPLSTIHYPLPRRGFSFAEVMFAVVILGIGFIMVAAIFPVAIQQTQSTGEENIAALAARDAADGITQLPGTIANPGYVPGYTLVRNADGSYPADAYKSVATYPVFPPTVKNYVLGATAGSVAPPAIVVPFTGMRWKLLQSDTIVVSDQRYAYVPFYRRENGSGAAELIVISVAVRNKPVYQTVNDALNTYAKAGVTTNTGGLDMAAGAPLVTPPPTPPTYTTIYPDTISISGQPAIEGCAATGPNQSPTGTPFKGRTYTCGLGSGGVFQINPGDGLALTAGSDGLWGNGYPIRDALLTGSPCTYTSSTTLQPQVAYATLQATPANPAGQITLSTLGTTNAPPSAGPGAFVIIADDFPFSPLTGVSTASYSLVPNYPAANPPYFVGALNGRIFRLGSVVGPGAFSIGTTYNLDPAYGMRPGGAASPDTVPNPTLVSAQPAFGVPNFFVKCYIVGIGQLTVNGVTTHPGNPQDIGVFATYFPVK